MASDDVNALATQQSIKAYVDSQVTAQDLDFVGDTGSGQVDLDSQTFQVTGTPNEIVTTAAGLTLNVSLPDNVTIGNNLDVTAALNANGDTNLGNATSDTITATGRFDSDLVPSADSTYDLGSSTLYWRNVYADNIGIGTTGTIGDDIVTRNLKVTGISTFIGNMHLLDNSNQFKLGAGSGTLFLRGDSANNISYLEHGAAGDFLIKSDGDIKFTRYSGGPHEKYAIFNRDSSIDLYYDNALRFQTSGIGVTITDQLDVNNINVSAGGTFGSFVDINADLDVDGQTEVDDLNVAGVSTFVGVGTFSSNLFVGGNLEVKGTSKFEGGTLSFGDSDTDNVVFGADIDSNIIPDDDSTYDLGSTGQRWRKIWVDDIGIGGTYFLGVDIETRHCLLYTSPSPRDRG